jgi:quercetin dioxygenase-like cupin family protein
VNPFHEVAGLSPQGIWQGVTARAVHGERVTFAVIELDANTVIPEHSHENEQVGLLLHGMVRFRIGEETRELHPGAAWRILANEPHEIETGPDGAVVAEVFSPPRDDWAEIEREPPRQPRWPSAS